MLPVFDKFAERLDDPVQPKHLATDGCELVQGQFDWQQVGRVYADLIDRRQARAITRWGIVFIRNGR